MRVIDISNKTIESYRVFFDVRLLDGITPATAEAGGQPELSVNGTSFTATGFSTLVLIGAGRYYADISQNLTLNPGDIIITRYKSLITVETSGDEFQVVDGLQTTFLETVGTESFSSYTTVTEGDQYFNNRLKSTLWFDQDTNTKLIALRQATRIIDRFNYDGNKADENQLLEFPRGIDTEVPTDIKIACFEIAYKLLDDVEIDFEVDNFNVESEAYDKVRTTYNHTNFVLDYKRAGIPSYTAWTYLVPYLRDPQSITLTRWGTDMELPSVSEQSENP